MIKKYIMQSLRLHKRNASREKQCALHALIHGGMYKCKTCAMHHSNDGCVLYNYIDLHLT